MSYDEQSVINARRALEKLGSTEPGSGKRPAGSFVHRPWGSRSGREIIVVHETLSSPRRRALPEPQPNRACISTMISQGSLVSLQADSRRQQELLAKADETIKGLQAQLVHREIAEGERVRREEAQRAAGSLPGPVAHPAATTLPDGTEPRRRGRPRKVRKQADQGQDQPVKWWSD